MATPRPTGALGLEIRTYLAAASAQRQALCSTDAGQGTLRGACLEAPVSPTLAIGNGEGTPGVCGPPKPSITLGAAVTTGWKAEGSEDPGPGGRFWSAAPSLCRVSFLQEVPGVQWWSGPRPTLARALSVRGQRRLRRWALPSCAVRSEEHTSELQSLCLWRPCPVKIVISPPLQSHPPLSSLHQPFQL